MNHVFGKKAFDQKKFCKMEKTKTTETFFEANTKKKLKA